MSSTSTSFTHAGRALLSLRVDVMNLDETTKTISFLSRFSSTTNIIISSPACLPCAKRNSPCLIYGSRESFVGKACAWCCLKGTGCVFVNEGKENREGQEKKVTGSGLGKRVRIEGDDIGVDDDGISASRKRKHTKSKADEDDQVGYKSHSRKSSDAIYSREIILRQRLMQPMHLNPQPRENALSIPLSIQPQSNIFSAKISHPQPDRMGGKGEGGSMAKGYEYELQHLTGSDSKHDSQSNPQREASLPDRRLEFVLQAAMQAEERYQKNNCQQQPCFLSVPTTTTSISRQGAIFPDDDSAATSHPLLADQKTAEGKSSLSHHSGQHQPPPPDSVQPQHKHPLTTITTMDTGSAVNGGHHEFPEMVIVPGNDQCAVDGIVPKTGKVVVVQGADSHHFKIPIHVAEPTFPIPVAAPTTFSPLSEADKQSRVASSSHITRPSLTTTASAPNTSGSRHSVDRHPFSTGRSRKRRIYSTTPRVSKVSTKGVPKPTTKGISKPSARGLPDPSSPPKSPHI